MFSCVWLHLKKNFEKYFLVFGKEEGRDKTQKKKIIKSGQIERRRKRERRLGSTRGEIARWRRRSQLARRRDRDRRHHLSPFAHSQDRSFSLSFSLCASVSSLCVSQFRKSFEVKIETEMNFRGQRCFFKVN